MKTNVFKTIFFTIVILLTILAIYIIYKDNKNEITKQDVSASIIERLLTTIQEQAEEIGRLRERVEQLECIKEAKERPVSGAQSSGLADVG